MNAGELSSDAEIEDTEEMRRKHPGGCAYSCCRGDDEEPCIVGGHQPDKSKRKVVKF